MEYEILTLRNCAETFLKRAKIDYDSVVAITGEEGSSKSTCAGGLILESLRINETPEDKIIPLFLERTIFSPNQEILEKQIREAPRYAFINADEAIKVLYKLNWNSNIQKFLNMLYALCRKENKTSLLCIPRFTDLNEFFRKHRVKFWIHIVDRGVGVLFAKDWNPFTDDPWWMYEGMKIITENYKRKKVTDFGTEDKIRMLSKVRNFVGVVNFDDLPTKIQKVYKEEKDKFGYDDLENRDVAVDFGAGARAGIYLDGMRNAAKELKLKGMSTKEIALLFKVTERTIQKYIKNEQEHELPSLSINKTKIGGNF